MRTAESLSEQAAVTQWPLRILLVLLTLAVIVFALWLLRHGWRNRARRQNLLLPDPPDAAVDWSAATPAVAGKYVGTVTAGQSLDRIVAAGGVAAARVRVGAAGVLVDRDGAAPLVIPARAITDVTTAPGLLQRYYGRHGLLLVSWLWAGREVSSGLWFSAETDQQQVASAVTGIMGHRQETA